MEDESRANSNGIAAVAAAVGTAIEHQPLPARIEPAHPAATAVAGRVLTLSAASADEQRKLARTLRDEAAANCAMIGRQITAFCEALAAEQSAITRDAEQRAKELEAVADKIESSAEGVARYLEDYANTLATVGEHTEDLHNRLRPPVPHTNGGQ